MPHTGVAENRNGFPPSAGGRKSETKGQLGHVPLKDLGKNPPLPLLASGGPDIPWLVAAELHLCLCLRRAVFSVSPLPFIRTPVIVSRMISSRDP